MCNSHYQHAGIRKLAGYTVACGYTAGYIHELVCSFNCSYTSQYIAHKVINVLHYLNLTDKKRLVFKPQCSLSHNSITSICKQMIRNRYDVCMAVRYIILHCITARLHYALLLQTNRYIHKYKENFVILQSIGII